MMQYKVFSEYDCKYIKKFADGLVSSSDIDLNSKTIKDFRICSEQTINNKTLNNFLISKLNNIIELDNLNDVRIIKYDIGQGFKLHKDRGIGYEKLYRTMIIQLSDSDEYIGGDLIINGIFAARDIGSIILFDSGKFHEVTEILDGSRYVLGAWLYQENFKKNKEIKIL